LFGSLKNSLIFASSFKQKLFKMKHVTVKELEAILFAFKTTKGANIFANIVQMTEPKMRKTDNPYMGVKKLSDVAIMLNTEYETGVINQLKREGKSPTEYEKGENTMPLEYGDNNSFVGYFKGKPVIQYRPNTNSKPETRYFFNGVEIAKTKLEPFLPVSKKAENQGTEKEILWRKVYLENVKQLKFQGEIYEIIQP
jgi:hypothetical protein